MNVSINKNYFSDQLKCSTKFSIYLPPTPSQQIPLIYWLSGMLSFHFSTFDFQFDALPLKGLTCSEQNFIDKSGFQKYASKHGFAVVGPDTSPSKNAFNKLPQDNKNDICSHCYPSI